MRAITGWILWTCWATGAVVCSADEWAAALPQSPAGIGRPASDRVWWGQWASSPEAKPVIRRAESHLGQATPAFDRERYLDYVRNGDRSRFQSLNVKRWNRFRELVLGECIENKGRFNAAIDETARSLCGDPSWLLPAHDHGAAVFKGGAPCVDLAVAMNGCEMALAAWLLEDRLPPEGIRLMRSEVARRLTGPVLALVDGSAPEASVQRNWWVRANHNWNAVCTTGALGAILATESSRDTRAKAVAWALKNTDTFLSGFAKDGYCSEGIGYWSYGFGHYLVLAEWLRAQTGGQLDLYTRQPVAQVAKAVSQLEIADQVFPAFADCTLSARPDETVLELARWRIEGQPLDRPAASILAEGALLYQTLANLEARRGATVAAKTANTPLPLRSWFPDSGVCVARPATPGGLAAAWKGGHNAEHHNHNDVGSTVVVWKGQPRIADLGAMVYRAETFGPDRYRLLVHSSFAHSVPVPAGMLQAQGRNAAAKVLATGFTDDRDTLTVDLKAAYPGADLRKLERTWTFTRDDQASLVIEDRFEFSNTSSFATALVGIGAWNLLEHTTRMARFRLRGTDGESLDVTADFSAPGRWDVSRIENPGRQTGTRLGLALDAPATTGFIRMTIRPPRENPPSPQPLAARELPGKLPDARRAP